MGMPEHLLGALGVQQRHRYQYMDKRLLAIEKHMQKEGRNEMVNT